MVPPWFSGSQPFAALPPGPQNPQAADKKVHGITTEARQDGQADHQGLAHCRQLHEDVTQAVAQALQRSWLLLSLLQLHLDFVLCRLCFTEHRLAQSVGAVIDRSKGHGIGDQRARHRHGDVSPQHYGERRSKRNLCHWYQKPEKDPEGQAKRDALSAEMP